jgi:hypothetical protein
MISSTFRSVVQLSILTAIIAASSLPARAQVDAVSNRLGANYQPSFGLLRDTLYLLDSMYIEVRLDQQMIYQHFRSGRVEKYLCSTGNPSIKDGIATREGIFAIQWKAKKHMSQEFGVYLNYWMPFDGGIGFHGLEGHSYYRHLGRRASSHGCVRISNETGARIFSNAPSGTVIYIHSGSPARILRFADSTLPGLQMIDRIGSDTFARRLNAVMANRWDDSLLSARIAIPPRSRFTTRLGVGRVDPKRVTQRPIELIKISPLSRLRNQEGPPRLFPVPLPEGEKITTEQKISENAPRQ